MNCPLLNSAHSSMIMMTTALEGTLTHTRELCIKEILILYSSFISLRSKMPIINNGRIRDGMPSPLKSGPWSVMISEIMVNASMIELARKKIQASEMKKNVKRILNNLGAMTLFLVILE